MTSQPRYQRAMLALAAAFNLAALDDAKLTVYWQALADLSDDEFSAAVSAAINDPDGRWPTPGMLRALARPQENPRTQAEIAFGRIQHECRAYNPVAGDYVSRAKVSTVLGPAALAAFESVGGAGAWREGAPTHRLRDFTDVFVAYQREAAQAERVKRLGLRRTTALPSPQSERTLP